MHFIFNIIPITTRAHCVRCICGYTVAGATLSEAFARIDAHKLAPKPEYV